MSKFAQRPSFIGRPAKLAIVLAVIASAFLTDTGIASATALPSTITENMTLTPAGNTYTGSPTIASGVTVKVEPGAKLTLGSITVEGTLLAEGTAENPILFTGIKREKVGEWRAITFVPGSGSSVLDHVEVANGGGRDSGYFDYNNGDINIEGSSPAIVNSTIRDAGGYGIKVTGGGSPEIANDLFSNAGDHAAITYTANSEQSGKINIHGNEIEGGAAGISVTVYTGAIVNSGTLSGNTVTGTAGTGITYSGPDVPGDITENTLTGNKTNYIQVGGTVAHSSTWNDGGSHVRLTGLTVASGVTLKITAGVHLMSPTMTVEGTLLVEGSAEKPVRFTGMNEEKVGEWRAITFVPGSSSSILDHVEIANGGNADAGYYNYNNGDINVEGASPTITNSTIRDAGGYGVKVSGGGAPEIANDSFSNAGEHSSISYTANSEQSGKINIHGNEIEGRGAGISATVYSGANVNLSISGNHIEGGTSGIAITVFSGATGNAEALSGNTVIDTEGIGISYSGPDVPGDITENTLSGNKLSYIQVGGTVDHSSTWNQGIPIRLTGLTIVSGVTLKITAGVHLINPTMTVEGTLLAEGSAANPARFTGMNEEKVGEWKAIFFKPGSGSSVLDHVEVANGGNADPGYYNYNNADIEIDGSSPTIINSTIRDAGGYGIKAPEGGGPEIANDAFSNAGEHSAISYTAGSGKSGEVNIHGNFIEGGGSGIGVTVNAAATVNSKTLSGNTVLGTGGTGVSYSGPDIPGDITENTLAGNVTNSISVSGTVAHSSTWNDGNARVSLSGGATIPAGVTLKITQGVYLIAPNFTVKGTLGAEGTSAEPVVFTGAKEEKSGEWKNLIFEPGSGESVLDHVEVGYGGSVSGSGMIEAKGSHPKITNSTLRNAKYYGIKVTESGSPQVEWDRFRNNANGLSYAGTGKLSVPNNDWECASGPKPAGCGNSVTTNVEWKPAIELPELVGHCRGKESQCGEGADPVSLATGQLDYSHQDLLLTNKSEMPLEFTRAYNSGSTSDTGLGPGWSQTGLASAAEQASGEVLVVHQDGRQDLFRKTESGYKSPSGVTDSLAKVEGTFQLTTLEGTVYRFDSSGRIASATDSHGLETTYAYNSEGRLSTITDPSSQTLAFAYNGSNHIISVKDSTGREVKFSYSTAGDLETVTDALGGVTKYAYDPEHRLTSITDPRSNVILKNVYNGEGKITEQEDGLGHLWKLEYKPSETIVTEPEGGQRKYGFDGQDRVISETDQLGHATTTAYDEAGNVHEVVQPGGAKWVFNHDAVGNLTSAIDPEGGERKYEYNTQNRPISFTDTRGNAWSYEWSKAGDLLKGTDPEKGETTLTYNESGQPLTKIDPDKHKTEFSYDSRGNELSETDPLGHKTSFEYNSRNYPISKTTPGLKAEKFERDAYGDLLSRTTPEGHVTKYAYDANGLPIQITDPGEDVWKIERNAMERPTAYIDPLEGQVKISYNGDLKPSKIVNRRGKETSYTYDLANELTEVKRPEGEDWHFGYDARGNRTSVIDPRKHETSYEFNPLNEMTKASEPLEVTTEYSYDANGDLASVKDPRGYTTTYEYDRLGRLTEVAQPLEKTTTYTYDAASNPLTKTTAVGTLEYGYNANSQLTEVKAGESTLRSLGYNADNLLSSATDAEGHELEVGYNEDGLVSSIKDGRGQSVARNYNSRGELSEQVDGRGTLKYVYDKLGRLTSLTDPQGKALGFGYDPEGDLIEVTRPNGVTTTNVYNEVGRLAETTSTEGGELPTTLESLKYGYDAAGNVISRVDQRLEAETTYAYDALNRLTEFNLPGEGAISYGYDKAGNRTEADGITYSYNALNQLTEASDGTVYSYDGAGRMTGQVKGTEETSYEWNLLDQLTKVEGPSEATSYVYDGLERPSERIGSGGTQVFHYGDLSDTPAYVANGAGETTTSYVQGAHGLVEQRSEEVTNYPLADGRGDITAISDSSGGIESRQEYGPWGEQLSGPSLEMGYLGAWERPTDRGTGLIQMGVRTYDPSLGGFASEDPVAGHMGIGGSVDRYLYVRDNPLGAYDLNGRDFCVPTPFGGACAEEAAEDVGNAAEDAWSLTAPGRQWISNRAQDFAKYASTHTFGVCLSGSAGAGIGANVQVCLAGNLHNFGATETLGGGALLPLGAGVGGGPLYSNASRNSQLGGKFTYGGASGRPLAGPTLGFNAASGNSEGRSIQTFYPWAGVSAGPPLSGEAGDSWTWTQGVSW